MKFLFLSVVALLLVSCNNNTIVIHTIGDSTMADYEENTTDVRGWGEMLSHFTTNNTIVTNYARGGRSTRSFYEEGLWDTVRDSIKEGDYLLIQFAHNDEKDKGNELTEGRGTAPWSMYQQYLHLYINEARKKGATPILIAPICRRYFDTDNHLTPKALHNISGIASDTTLNYVKAMQNVAHELCVPFIDMTSRTRDIVESLGPDLSKKLLYVSTDNTHTSAFGAAVYAQATVSELIANGILTNTLRDCSFFVNPQKFNCGTIYTNTKQVYFFDAINIGGDLNSSHHFSISTSSPDISLSLCTDTTPHTSLCLDTIGAITFCATLSPEQIGQTEHTITIESGTEKQQITITANVVEPTERKPFSANLYTPLAEPSFTEGIVLHEATLSGINSLVEGILPTDGTWSAEIDENDTRYIQFHLATSQVSIINEISLTTSPDLCYRIVCSHQKNFTDRITIGECFSNGHAETMTFRTAISSSANARLFFRIYPWSKTETKEPQNLTNITIKGVAYK